MVDPAGRFYDAVDGGYRYGRPILSDGVGSAMTDVRADLQQFLNRDGLYKWD
jgi:hypothetical protein